MYQIYPKPLMATLIFTAFRILYSALILLQQNYTNLYIYSPTPLLRTS